MKRRQLPRNRRTGLATAALCHRIVPVWHPAFPLTLLRARRLCTKEGFEPAEAFRLGLFRPGSRRRHPEYVSRREMARIQESLNPIAWAPLLESKDLFYRYCTVVEAPIPRLFAVIHAKLPGWTYTGHLLRTRSDWMAFFDNSLPAEFAVRPAQGAGGQGFHTFRRVGKEYTDAAGTRRETEELYNMLVSDAAERRVIQERLHNHPELIRLSDTETLQTARIITLVDNDGQVHVLHAHLKIVEGNEPVEPSIRDLTGNIEAPVHLRHGTLATASRIPGNGKAATVVPSHPRTRIVFEGFHLPFWTDACQLVRQTALKFIPIRTVGWDVAMTPDGPIIVEGDIWWEPPNQHGGMVEILRALCDPSLPTIQRSDQSPGEHSTWQRLFTDDRRS